jgi:hypothetical protein
LYRLGFDSVDKFTALFGNEFGLNMNEVLSSGFLPVPRLCFCIEVRDRQRLLELLEKFGKGLTLSRHKLGTVEVVSLEIAGGLMQPAYALTSRFLLVADNRSQIEAILQPGVDTLNQEADFKRLTLDMTGSNNLVAFVRCAPVVEGMKELVKWVGTIVAISNPQRGRSAQELIGGVVLPLLDGLKMYRLAGMRSYIDDGDLVYQTTATVEADNE